MFRQEAGELQTTFVNKTSMVLLGHTVCSSTSSPTLEVSLTVRLISTLVDQSWVLVTAMSSSICSNQKEIRL